MKGAGLEDLVLVLVIVPSAFRGSWLLIDAGATALVELLAQHHLLLVLVLSLVCLLNCAALLSTWVTPELRSGASTRLTRAKDPHVLEETALVGLEQRALIILLLNAIVHCTTHNIEIVMVLRRVP